jgi:hypothetical protein
MIARAPAVALALLSVLPSWRLPLAVLSAQDTIPAGYGSLRRDDVAIRFRTPQVEIQLLPLDEQVIRLLAPDTYQSLTALLRTRAAELAEAAERAGVARPMVFMVTFLGVVPAARFSPDDVTITSRGRLFRPVGVVPLSPRWGSYQLDAREQAAALYLYEDGIGLAEHLTVAYQGMANDAWGRAVSLLERERARVAARARTATEPPRP